MSVATAAEQLSRALDDLAEVQWVTPCQTDPEPFASDSHRVRAEAARLCRWCPVVEECGAAADERDETWLVWGGTDRTRIGRPRRRSAVECEDESA